MYMQFQAVPGPITDNLITIQIRFDGLHFPGDDGAVIRPGYFMN